MTASNREHSVVSEASRAAVFTAAGQPLRLRRFPFPQLRPQEVLVRVTCCTICRSDVHTYLGHRSTPTPTMLGHEMLGVIAALGPGAPILDYQGKRLQEGDRITWSVAANCDACFSCEQGLPQKCECVFKYGHEAITDRHALGGGMHETTSGRGVDVAIESSGAHRAMQEGLNLLRVGGRYVLVGAAKPTRALAVDPETVIRRLLNIQGVHNYTPTDLFEALQFLVQHYTKYPFEELVTATFSLPEAELAFQQARLDPKEPGAAPVYLPNSF